MTREYKYSRSNRQNLLLPIQRQLSEKLTVLTKFFIPILKITLKLEHFGKHQPHSSSSSEFIDSEKRVYLIAYTG